MQAVLIDQYGGPEVMYVGDAPAPEAGPGEILVKVEAAGVNNADMTARAGRYLERTPVPGIYFYPMKTFPAIPGIELAGTVAALGEGVTRWKIGDRVCGISGTGAYSEYVRMLEWVAMPVPDKVSMVEAASIPIAFLTAWIAITDLMHVQAGEDLLIHAVGAGVGQAMVQYGSLIGARVLGTEIADDKLERARGLGMVEGINSRENDFVAWVMEKTGGKGVDAVVDTLGGPVFASNLRALAINGRIVPLSTTLGNALEIELGNIIGKHLAVRGMSTAAMLTPERIARFSRDVLSQIGTTLRPMIDRTFSLSEASDAHRHLAGGQHFGKIVLTIA